MAALALLLAVVYAALARAELALRPSDRRILLVTLGTALTFVTLAIPVQLESNWITIAWAVEAVALLWAGLETGARPLRAALLAGLRPGPRPLPVLGHALGFARAVHPGLQPLLPGDAGGGRVPGRRRVPVRPRPPARRALAGLVAFAVLWVGTSVEAYTYFSVQAQPIANSARPESGETVRRLLWAAQLALSLLWSTYAGLFTAAGFRRQSRALRTTGTGRSSASRWPRC